MSTADVYIHSACQSERNRRTAHGMRDRCQDRFGCKCRRQLRNVAGENGNRADIAAALAVRGKIDANDAIAACEQRCDERIEIGVRAFPPVHEHHDRAFVRAPPHEIPASALEHVSRRPRRVRCNCGTPSRDQKRIENRFEFDDFVRAIGCARNLLTTRLARLVDAGILERVPYREPGQRARDEFALTTHGRELATAVAAFGRSLGVAKFEPAIVADMRA